MKSKLIIRQGQAPTLYLCGAKAVSSNSLVKQAQLQPA